METTTSGNLFELHIDGQSQNHLSQAAKWAKFLSIVGFVCCGVIILVGVFAGTIFSTFSSRFGSDTTMPGANVAAGVGGAFMFVWTLVIAVIYFFPCLFLFRFSTKIKSALLNNEQELLASSFANLKSFYKYIGILTIIGLSFFVLEILFVIIFAASMPR